MEGGAAIELGDLTVKWLVVASFLAVAAPALASAGPSFDYNKASNAIERTIYRGQSSPRLTATAAITVRSLPGSGL